MNSIEQEEYRLTLKNILTDETSSKSDRRAFLANERETEEYKSAKLERNNQRRLFLDERKERQALDEAIALQPIDESENPLISFIPDNRPLTAEEEQIVWANSVVEEYRLLPKTTNSERKKARAFLDQTVRRIVGNPDEMDRAASIWKSHVREGEDTEEGEKSYYTIAKEQAAAYIKEHWEDISAEQLAEILKGYSYSQIAKDFGRDILKAYFAGPTSRKQTIDNLYLLAEASLKLIDDPQALETVVSIGNFNDILQRRSEYYTHFSLATSANLGMSPEDEQLLRRGLTAQGILFDLTHLTSIDQHQIYQSNSAFNRDLHLQEKVSRELDKLLKKYPNAKDQAKIEARIMALYNYHNQRAVVKAGESAWPNNIIADDPLHQQYSSLIGSYIASVNMREYEVAPAFEKAGYKIEAQFTITTPDGYKVDILTTQLDSKAKGELIKSVLSQVSENEKKVVDESINGAVPIRLGISRFEEKPYAYIIRGASEHEKKAHPLQSLEAIGFPIPQVEGDIHEYNMQLVDKILRNPGRFLNIRGVTIPVNSDALKDSGYTHFSFHKDKQSPEQTVVKVGLGQTEFAVKLDRNLAFNFEGKTCVIPDILEGLRYAIFNMLYPILCEQKIKLADGDERELELEVTSRMGHLRWLTKGQHYSQAAVLNCLKYEGKDLAVLDTQRKKEKKTEMNSTYVKPIIDEEGENLPPISITLPNTLHFYH